MVAYSMFYAALFCLVLNAQAMEVPMSFGHWPTVSVQEAWMDAFERLLNGQSHVSQTDTVGRMVLWSSGAEHIISVPEYRAQFGLQPGTWGPFTAWHLFVLSMLNLPQIERNMCQLT